MGFIDENEITMAIAYLVGALPREPRWVLLMKTSGEIIGHYHFRPENGQITTIITGMGAHSNRCAAETGNGSFRYNLNIATDGAQLTMPLGNDYLVCVNMPHMQSFDAFVHSMYEGLTPLKDALRLS